MNFFNAALVVFISLYTALHAALFFGIIAERRREKRGLRAPLDDALASVIVPVRNEEAALPALLASLACQTHRNIEYIFIDDASSDATAQILAAWKEKTGDNAAIITMKDGGGVFNRKQRALAEGAALAKGDVLLFTDADCVVPRDWARYMTLSCLRDGVGVILGPVYKDAAHGARLLYEYQAFDQLVRGMYIAGAVGLGAAGGGFGNNIAVRREALNAAGGYERVPPSLTEDAALISLIRQNTRFKTRAVYDAASHVATRSENSWRALINQTLRWHLGGLFSSDPTTALSFWFVVILYFFCALCIPLAVFYPPFLLGPLFVWIEVALGNLPVKIWSGKSLPLKTPAYIFLSLFMEYFFDLLTILALAGKKPLWKENVFTKGEKNNDAKIS